MARRRTKDAELGAGMFLLLVIGLPIWLFSKAADTLGLATIVVGILALFAGGIYLWYKARAERRARLLLKYGDPTIVDAIMRKRYWQGQTHEQLVDSIGGPAAIDDHFLKTKKRQVWKYHQTGKYRYRLRVTLENDVVTGWDQKA